MTSADWDVLVGRLADLRAAQGNPSFGELAVRIGEVRRSRGRAHAQPGRTTVYDLFRPGRSRVDTELLLDAVTALGIEGVEAEDWRRACRTVSGAPAPRPDDVARAQTGAPQWRTPFVGRAEELSTILQRAGGGGAVSVTGLGGSGKSRLAARAMSLLHTRGRVDTIVHVDLRGHDPELAPTSAHAVARAALEVVGVSVAEDHVAELRRLLETRPIGLLLDDAKDVAQVADLLPTTGRSVVLLTTRTRTDHPAVRHVPLGRMAADESRRLLEVVMRRERSADDTSAADRLVELGGGLPLALELLAARAAARPDWSLDDVAEQAARLRSSHHLEEPLRAAVASAYEAVQEPARELLRHLASQPCSSLDLDAVISMDPRRSRDIDGTVQALVTAHLVDLTPGPGGARVSVHDVVRAYVLGVAEHTDPPSRREAAIDRLCSHLVHRLWACSGEFMPFGLLTEETPEVLALRPPRLDLLSHEQAREWMAHNADTLIELVAACVERRPQVTVAATPVLAAWLHAHYRFADAVWLVDHAKRAALLWGNPRAVAEMAFARGTVLTWTANPRNSLEDLAEAEAAIQELADPQARQAVVASQSLCNRYAGELDTAVEQALEALALRPPGDPDRVNRWWTAISCLTLLGREEDARALEARIASEDVTADRSAEAFHRFYRAEDLLLQRRWLEAAQEAERGIAVLEDAGFDTIPGSAQAYGRVVLAAAWTHVGRGPDAERQLRESLLETRSAGDQQLELFVLTLHGEALLACDRPTEAVEVLQEGRRLALRLANPVGEADVLEVLARCQDLLGRASEARSCRAQAAELWSMMGSTRGVALGLTESCA
ncbi:ATP-binding protein [uncultured Nocardioides sp.]|uniref:ATP-binding protein n=2 Tax=uncultured Nocardioides sp. TaxID=198441 RepID=UPI00342AF650